MVIERFAQFGNNLLYSNYKPVAIKTTGFLNYSKMALRNKIGVLDLQGGVLEHINHLQAIGIDAVRVKKAEHFETLAGLILPGGESTCLTRLLNIFNLIKPLKSAFNDGMKVWGTCAGAILLSTEVENEKPHLGLMDIKIARNAFGFQVDSFKTSVLVPLVSNQPVDLTFIRAPKIKYAGNDVNVLLQIDDYIAAAESKMCLATVFHPELTQSPVFHKYFVQKCGLQYSNTICDNLDRTSWMKYARVTAPSRNNIK